MTLQTALALSLNTVSAQLTAEVGPAAVAATAHRLGIASPLQATPSIALGTSEVTLARADRRLRALRQWRPRRHPACHRAASPPPSGKVLYERAGSGPGPGGRPGLCRHDERHAARDADRRHRQDARQIAGWPAAGKTGTSPGFPRRLVHRLHRRRWSPASGSATTTASRPRRPRGSNLPAIAWQRFMSEALDGVPVVELPGGWGGVRHVAPGGMLPGADVGPAARRHR